VHEISFAKLSSCSMIGRNGHLASRNSFKEPKGKR
jgi:hypothetical protein